jgi:hypothetical protein
MRGRTEQKHLLKTKDLNVRNFFFKNPSKVEKVMRVNYNLAFFSCLYKRMNFEWLFQLPLTLTPHNETNWTEYQTEHDIQTFGGLDFKHSFRLL